MWFLGILLSELNTAAGLVALDNLEPDTHGVRMSMRSRTLIISLTIALLSAVGCSQSKAEPVKGSGAVTELNGIENLKSLLDTSGQRLLVFDLYADWCMPCKILSPLLDKIAKEHGDKASFFKVNIDRNPEIAGAFGVQGIPFVVFVRDKVGLDALTGVHPEATYVRAIERLQASPSPKERDTPDGDIVDGVRVIHLNTAMAPGDLYVYRGETVRLVYDTVTIPYSIHIPHYDVSEEAAAGSRLEVTFKAKDVGVFPMFCNGDCPAGDGAGFGQVIVMQYKSTTSSSYEELDAKQAKVFIEKNNPVIVDVRTPREFYSGHIPGATLIPLQQLAQRVNELEAHRGRPIFLYCRSGNRSTVAAQILAKNGFQKLYNLRPGILGWQKEKFEVEKKKG